MTTVKERQRTLSDNRRPSTPKRSAPPELKPRTRKAAKPTLRGTTWPRQSTTPTASMTLADYLTIWLRGQTQLRESTKVSYEGHIRNYIVPALGSIPLAELNATDVECFIQGLVATGMRPTTAERIMATLRAAIYSAIRTGRIQSNPVQWARIPGRRIRDLNTCQLADAREFLASLGKGSLDVLFRLALLTGMRRGGLH